MTARRTVTLICDGMREIDSRCNEHYQGLFDQAVSTTRLEARRYGWRLDGLGRDLCPDCAGTNR